MASANQPQGVLESLLGELDIVVASYGLAIVVVFFVIVLVLLIWEACEEADGPPSYARVGQQAIKRYVSRHLLSAAQYQQQGLAEHTVGLSFNG
jgi:hypothetical protein